MVNPVSEEVSTPPNIFDVSHSIFSSSPPIYGTTLSKISKLATPGYPTITSPDHQRVLTSPRNSLHSNSTNLCEPSEFILQCLERDNQPCRTAIRIGNHESLLTQS